MHIDDDDNESIFDSYQEFILGTKYVVGRLAVPEKERAQWRERIS